jgi:hypothetical protein
MLTTEEINALTLLASKVGVAKNLSIRIDYYGIINYRRTLNRKYKDKGTYIITIKGINISLSTHADSFDELTDIINKYK